jgi:pyruvate dehydrogenase E2 component (dihydrolipoamide acetyltransferase)
MVQVPSPKSGTLLKTFGNPGEKVHVGDVLCSIGEAGEKPALVTKIVSAAKAEIKRRPAGAVGELEEAPEEEAKPAVPMPPKKVAEPMVAVMPAVRKLAQEMGVDISKVQGSGPEGRITEDDVRRGAGKAEKESPRAPTITFERFGRVLRIPLKGIRKTIAENMTQSLKTAAHVTHMDYADVTKLAAYREKEKEEAEKKGVKLTFLPFVVKACVLALKEFPYVNSSLDDEKQEIVIKQYYHIGMAVDTPAGLMVPVIHNANEKTILEIARDVWRLAELARTREIQLKDLQGSTFTITNIGSLGGEFATPVINYPECAILALGRISEKPLVIDGKIEIRKVLPLSLSFDHRIIDGAMAAKFVGEVKRHLEDPDALLMGY